MVQWAGNVVHYSKRVIPYTDQPEKEDNHLSAIIKLTITFNCIIN